jgi:precorrin-3B C17-methyltransferase
VTSLTAGRLTVVGIGPGPLDWVTPAASTACAQANDLYGYSRYLDRAPGHPGQSRHASDNGDELQRANAALAAAHSGRNVVVVSGGDPGVFAMASAVCEAIDGGPPQWRELDVRVEPGVTAMLAAAARVGAPLGADFACLSLSDNLKPWSLIEKRLRLMSEAGLALALYNPASRARPDQIAKAFEILLQMRGAQTPVIVATAIGRPDEQIEVVRLGAADPRRADMRTLIIVGTEGTRIIERPGLPPLVYTERFAREA